MTGRLPAHFSSHVSDLLRNVGFGAEHDILDLLEVLFVLVEFFL